MEQSPSWEAKRFSASKKLPTFCGTRRFITAFTRVRHLSLSGVRSILSMPFRNIPSIPILILFSHLCLGLSSSSFPQFSPPQPCMHPAFPPTGAKLPAHLNFYLITRIISGVKWADRSSSCSFCSLLHSPVTSSLSGHRPIHIPQHRI
jgi:hypothetical protein